MVVPRSLNFWGRDTLLNKVCIQSGFALALTLTVAAYTMRWSNSKMNMR